jgi:conjugative transposon TraN protein
MTKLFAFTALGILLSATSFAQTNDYTYTPTSEASVAKPNSKQYNLPQASTIVGNLNQNNVKTIFIDPTATVHFVCDEDISYVDLSTTDAVGELADNRIFKMKSNNPNNSGNSFVMTIVTAKRITVYKVMIGYPTDIRNSYLVKVKPEDSYNYSNASTGTTAESYAALANKVYMKKGRNINNISTQAYDINFFIKNIYVKDDLIFFDMGVHNKSNLQYNVETIRFMIEDKEKVNSSIAQDLTIEPLYSVNPINEKTKPIIKGKYENTFVLPKFTYPNRKILHIEMTEGGISGRKSDLYVEYNQILAAETLN